MNYAAMNQPSSRTLLEIIRVQTEIARLGLDLGGVMSLATERVQAMLKANGAVVEFVDGEEMVYRAGSGVCAAQLGLRLKRNGSLSGLCVDMASVLRCDDAEIDSRVDREACRRGGLRSMLVAPLKHAGVAIGVFKVTAPSVAAFTNADAEVLELMCELIAASMFHAARYGASDLYMQATHDALTGLPNKALFYDRLRQSLELAQRQAARVGILLLEMSSLADTNALLGHRAGNAAVQETGARIRKTARRSDTVARVAEDGFAVVLPGVGGQGDAEIQARRLAETVPLPFDFEGRMIEPAIDIGLAVFPDHGKDITALMGAVKKAADEARRARTPSLEDALRQEAAASAPVVLADHPVVQRRARATAR